MIELLQSMPGGPAVSIAVLLTLCVGLVAWAVLARRSPLESEVDRRLQGLLGGAEPGAQPRENRAAVVHDEAKGALVSKLSVFSKPLDNQTEYERHHLAIKLSQGGIRKPGAVKVFLGAKMLLMSALGVAGCSYALSTESSMLNTFCYTIIGAVLGFYIPNLWLRQRVSKRSERITNALPDSLDMLVIAVEAGLGLDAAIQRVGDEMRRTYPELAEEWIIACRETQMGIPRSEALRKMAQRTSVPDMHSLVAIVAQAERLGTGIAQTLRVHAETMRVKRRQRAEERAAKTTVKLLIPLIIFLFPVIFVVIMGPACINAMRSGIFK